MDTVQPLEVIWLLIAAAGCGFSAYNMLDSRADLRAVALLKNGNRDVAVEVASLTFANALSRLVMFTYLVLIGLVAVTIPPSTQPVEHPIAGALIGGLLVLLATTMLVSTLLMFYGRRRIMRLLQTSAVVLAHVIPKDEPPT